MSTFPASSKWRPATSLAQLQQRAVLLRAIREYFFSADVTEVVTPVLSRHATTDPHIESFATQAAATSNDASTGDHTSLRDSLRYLHTSPEFPMKRLLCAGAGDIYQICSVFRREEAGRLHNPEFQLLEWYRCGFDHRRLMQDVENFVRHCCTALYPDEDGQAGRSVNLRPVFQKVRYYDAVEAATGLSRQQLNPVSLENFFARQRIDCPLRSNGPEADALDTWLDFLMSVVVAPGFDVSGFTFVYDYPASQAALARLLPQDNGFVAARFELFYGEIELANGFHELADTSEQRTRFETDLSLRQQQGLAAVPMDIELLDALAHGLPDCAGVAIGLDRLLMMLTGARHIDDVMAFPDDRA